MLKPLRYIIILPLLILLVGTACKLSGTPTPTPAQPVPVIPTQEQPLEKPVPTAQPDPNPEKIILTVTETQITTHIVENLQKEYESLLTNPVVVFQPDQVELYGTIKGGIFSADGKIVFSVTIDPNGKPVVKILQANFGPFPIPTDLLSNISTVVDRAIAESMKDYQAEYRLEKITFTTGLATITITKK